MALEITMTAPLSIGSKQLQASFRRIPESTLSGYSPDSGLRRDDEYSSSSSDQYAPFAGSFDGI